MANGSNKRLTESTKTWNYTDQDSFFQQEQINQIQRDTSHRINFGLRYRIDSTQNMILNGALSLSSGFNPMNSQSSSFLNTILTNTLARTSTGESGSFSGNAGGSYLKKFNRNRSVLKVTGNFSMATNESASRYMNSTAFSAGNEQVDSRFQQVASRNLNYSAGISINQRIAKRLYVEPEIKAGNSRENYSKILGIPLETDFVIDSLSPDFTKNYQYIHPEISIKRNTDKIQFSATLGMEMGRLASTLWDEDPVKAEFRYLTPGLSWENEYKAGRRLSVFYQSSVNTPSVSQMMPVVDNTNPLSLMYGNQNLRPEYSHNINFHWLLFDQFTFTSLFTSVYAGYTHDKINWARTVDENLVQTMTLTNVDNDYQVGGNVDFSTVIRKLGMKAHTSIRENLNRGISLVNGTENINTTLSHRVSLTFDNRKKVKWDINAGASFTLTDSWYSIQKSLNNRYVDFSVFSELQFTPSDRWNFNLTADVTNYTARSFDESISIPLIGAEVSYTFLKHNRGILTLQGVDLLNKNTGLQRISEMNYLMERQSNIIGRYVLLSFKYRLNKFGSNDSGFDVKITR